MSQSTTFKIETFNSKMNWRIPDAIKWITNERFCETSSKMVFENFPCKWRVEVYNDGGSDSVMFRVTLVRQEEPSEEEEGYMYKIEAFIVRGLCKSAWKYYESGPWKLKESNYFEKFVEKTERIKNVLHYGKDFEIEVFVKIFKLVQQDKYVEKYDSMPCKLDALAHIKALYKEGKNTDISINYKDIHHKCHKSVLAARSKFFASLLKDAPDVVFYQFDDNDSVNKETLEEFINFIYTGESQLQSLDNSRILMGLGNTFGIADLKEIHENVLIAHTTHKNALEMLNTAIKYKSCHGLKDTAFECVKRHYKHLNIEIPDDLINHPNAIMSYASDAMVKMVKNLRI